MTIDLGKLNPDLAKLALEGMGFSVNGIGNILSFSAGQGAKITGSGTLDIKAGQMTLYNSNLSKPEAIQKFKQAYGRGAVLETAKRQRWQIKEVAANKFEVIRRQ